MTEEDIIAVRLKKIWREMINAYIMGGGSVYYIGRVDGTPVRTLPGESEFCEDCNIEDAFIIPERIAMKWLRAGTEVFSYYPALKKEQLALQARLRELLKRPKGKIEEEK